MRDVFTDFVTKLHRGIITFESVTKKVVIKEQKLRDVIYSLSEFKKPIFLNSLSSVNDQESIMCSVQNVFLQTFFRIRKTLRNCKCIFTL